MAILSMLWCPFTLQIYFMNDVFCEYLNDFVVYYIDDILISPKTWKSTNDMFDLFWTNSRKSNFTPN
jgi:hypothetical protein